ncbi:MAG: LytR C-terminal domain-containing protein, partial [Pseudorhodobacter sp.]|nr:LytR C-terminal domain-containing protein [Frankiaceae bacterium]
MAAATAAATPTVTALGTAAGTTDRPVGSRRARAAQQQASARGRAFAGAVVALLAVLLGVGALNLLAGNRGADDGRGAVVSLPSRAGTATASTVPSPTTPPTPGPSAPAPSPAVPTATPKALPLTSPPLTTPAPASPAASPPPAPAAVAPVLPVTVLNSSRVAGLADRAASQLRAGGWPTPVVGNFRGRVARTTVYWAPGQQASAV